MISERDFISNIREQIIPDNKLLVKGIGDDCAVYRIDSADSSRLGLISVDSLVEGVHFDLSWHPPTLLGKKAAAVNISDIAAMGGQPTFLLLSIAVPAKCNESFLEAFVHGFLAQAKAFGAILIGGDTVKSGSDMSVSVTVLGEVSEDCILYRSGAKVGDLVWVSGTLGDAAGGLMICSGAGEHDVLAWPSLIKAHLDPTPEVALGLILSGSGLVTAMIDMSDGLGTDLAHICEESSCGAVIDAGCIPVSDALKSAAAAYDVSCLDLAVSGGEDYRLLFTSPASAKEELCGKVRSGCGMTIYCIGEIVAEQGVSLKSASFDKKVGFTGFDHFRN
nr:thiamine-phosphate kinase [Desulfobulbaceae bacterium]